MANCPRKMDKLNGLDVLLALKLAVLREGAKPSLDDLREQLDAPRSSLSLAEHRLRSHGLLRPEKGRHVNRLALIDFLENGLRWLMPARPGPIELGIPTAHSAEPLAKHLAGDDDPVVMPLPGGPVRGRAIEPIHKSAPRAAELDPQLHQLLALADALRSGRARDRNLASKELRACL